MIAPFRLVSVHGGQWVNCVATTCTGDALSMAKRQADLDRGVEMMLGTHPASTPSRRDGLPRSAQAATAALACWFAFQFQGSRSAILLAG